VHVLQHIYAYQNMMRTTYRLQDTVKTGSEVFHLLAAAGGWLSHTQMSKDANTLNMQNTYKKKFLFFYCLTHKYIETQVYMFIVFV